MKLTKTDIVRVVHLGFRAAFTAPPRSGKTTVLGELAQHSIGMNPVIFSCDRWDAYQAFKNFGVHSSNMYSLYQPIPDISTLNTRLVIIDDPYLRASSSASNRVESHMVECAVAEIDTTAPLGVQVILSGTRFSKNDIFGAIGSPWRYKHFAPSTNDPDYVGLEQILGKSLWDCLYMGLP
jgi:hypothetical protein